MAGLLAASMLCACGGGGGGASSVANSNPQTPTTTETLDAHTSYTAATPTTGDNYTYKVTFTDTSTGATGTPNVYYYNQFYTATNPDGTSTREGIESQSNDTPIDDSLNADGSIAAQNVNQVLGSTAIVPNSYCNYPLSKVDIPGTLSVGLSWDSSTAGSCSSWTMQWRSQGNVVGIESVTVAAGTFETMKLTYTTTTVKTAVITSNSGTSVTAKTCWRDVKLGINVKCTGTTTFTPSSDGAARSGTIAEELVGYVNAKKNVQKLAVERFAGTWTGIYSGTASGTCNIQVSTTGSISGTCRDSSFANFDVSGNIDAQGNLTANLSSNGVSGPTFKGSSMSMLTWSGNWATGNASGTWSLYHN
jgi:hypothetical protein